MRLDPSVLYEMGLFSSYRSAIRVAAKARFVALLALLLWPGPLSATGKSDADRIADVHAIARLAERFMESCDHYPLADMYGNVRITVHLSESPLPERFQFPPPGRSGVVLPAEEFEGYLRETLGPEVEVPRDDRPLGDLPHFYIYTFDGKDYFVSAVLERPTEQTRNVAGWYDKYEVGSKAVPERKIRRFGAEPLYPDVLAARATRQADGSWRFDVTLSSPYDSSARYADAWRVLAPDGSELGVRILGHDHANEQPFTRSLHGVQIPAGITTVTIQGRDQLSGWGGATVAVELGDG